MWNRQNALVRLSSFPSSRLIRPDRRRSPLCGRCLGQMAASWPRLSAIPDFCPLITEDLKLYQALTAPLRIAGLCHEVARTWDLHSSRNVIPCP